MGESMDNADLAALHDHRFGLGGRIKFSWRAPGIETALVEEGGARAELSLHGAHMLSWCPPGGKDVLFLSPRSAFVPGSPIRGGIPVCWPWFGPHPSDARLPLHGVARVHAWTPEESGISGGAVRLRLSLESSDATRSVWSHDFRLELRISVGNELSLDLTARNTGSAPWPMSCAFHPYFRVGDAASARVRGLEGASWTDRAGGAAGVQQGDVTLSGPLDRIFGAEGPLEIIDPVLERRIGIVRDGFPSTVVWNPWERAAQMPDLGADSYPHMLCVEPARVAGQELTLEPGASASMGFRISVR